MAAVGSVRPGIPVRPHQYVDGGLDWDPDHPVLRFLAGSAVRSLDLAAAVTSAWHRRPMDSVLLSPDGRTLATAERSGARYVSRTGADPAPPRRARL
ncbi:hypothetical protein [Streptomyces sp. NPDC012616]|uniref:hypothetical protein n=1 Tax=Streptomyces sp. NPDC012616 TaxID=3364840 RepID=UPI0036E32E3D